MKINFAKIYEGWRNYLIPPAEIKQQILRVASERTDICERCESHSDKHNTFRLDKHCTECGCTISAKVSCLSCDCPLDKWMAEITYQQEEILKTID